MNSYEHTSREFLPLSVIRSACAGDTDAVEQVLRHYRGYINKLCTGILYDKHGQPHVCIDEYMKRHLEIKLISSIVTKVTEKAPEKPIKLSSVGEPMPISKASPEEAPAPRPRPERPNPLEERAKHMPAQSSAPTNAAEWVGEPMPITKKQDDDQGLAKQVEAPLEMPTQEKEAEKRPAPEHASAPQRSEAATPLNTVPDLNLDEWVGEPTPIIKPLPVSAPLPAPEEAPLTLEPEQKVSPKKRDNAPLTLAPTDDAPLTLTAQTDKADEPLMLGTPLPDKKSSLSNDVLMLDEPLGNQPELSLAGLGLEPQAEVINLTEPVRKPTPAQPAEKDAPIPDLFGDFVKSAD